MIDLQTLTISYGKKVLVDSVNAEFAPGTVYGLVAPNGHGKTTLLRAMAGLPGPRVDGSIVLDEVQGTGAREVRSMIFYAPGEGTLLYLVRGRCCIPDCVRKITSRWFAICGRMLAISKR